MPTKAIDAKAKIYLLTYMRVFGLGFIKLLPDEAAQTQNPYVILIPYYVALYTWPGFFYSCIPLRVTDANVKDDVCMVKGTASISLRRKVLPFPAKIYPFEIFTRALPASSLV